MAHGKLQLSPLASVFHICYQEDDFNNNKVLKIMVNQLEKDEQQKCISINYELTLAAFELAFLGFGIDVHKKGIYT